MGAASIDDSKPERTGSGPPRGSATGLLGLDLGTSKACAAGAGEDGRPRVLVSEAITLDERKRPQSEKLDQIRFLVGEAGGRDARGVVLAVRPGARDADRGALTADAAASGWKIEDVIRSPVAVAHGLGLHRRPPDLVAILDLGASAAECCLVRREDKSIRVLACARDPELAGDRFDARIVDVLVRSFRTVHDVDLAADPKVVLRMTLAAETAKRALAIGGEHKVHLEKIAEIGGRALDLKVLLPRAVFLDEITPLLDRVQALCDDAVKQAGVGVSDVAEVVMVGGTSRLPELVTRVQRAFHRAPRVDAAPEQAVALGAAVYAREVLVPDDRITSPYGAPEAADRPAGAGQAKLQRKTQVGRVATRKMFAEGAPGIEVLDARLAVSTVGGFCDEILPTSEKLPADRTRVFTTGHDGQTAVKIAVCQGTSRRYAENRELGTLVLAGLASKPRGSVRIAVTFSVDRDGMLEASARDEQSGRAQTVRIQLGSAGPTEENPS